MARNSLTLLLVALLAAGCADEERAAGTSSVITTTRTTAAAPKLRCVAARARGFRLCKDAAGAAARVPATIQRRGSEGWRVVAASPRRTMHDGFQVGHWEQAWLSPDGLTLLAQWSAECEVPVAFFVDVRTGRMRVVTGEKDWVAAPESIPLGWVGDGRARVRLPKGACGKSASVPGVYLIDPVSGRLTREARE